MQIVIDISENIYNLIARGEENRDFVYKSGLMRAILEGTPLPKGHGRLGDLDALETEMVNGIHAGNYEEGYETFSHIVDMDDCVDCVRYADTIIEADEGE